MGWIKMLLLVIALVYLLVGLFLFLFQESLIFRPEPLASDFEYAFETPFEELNLEMEDGAILNALLFKPENPKGALLYFHGNAGNLERWGEIAEPFAAYGYEVLILDYRGYGKSTGRRNKKRMLEDAELVYAYVTERWTEKDIVVFGRSIGSAFACHVAGNHNPGKLILETPFASIGDVVQELLWMYPTPWILSFNFNNLEKADKISCPTLVLHGDEDLVVPIKSGKKLAQAIPNAHFEIISGGGHNDLAAFKRYWDILDQEMQ